MLCQFTVKNYKSIRDEMTFVCRRRLFRSMKISDMDKNREQFLPVSAYWSKRWWKIKCLGSIAYCGSKVFARCMQQEITRNVFFFRKLLLSPLRFQKNESEPTDLIFFRTD